MIHKQIMETEELTRTDIDDFTIFNYSTRNLYFEEYYALLKWYTAVQSSSFDLATITEYSIKILAS